MARLPEAEVERLRSIVRTHDFLHRIARVVERLHRLVFHAHTLDVQRMRSSAEEIVIADLMLRHRGNCDGVYHALREAEARGKTWAKAIDDYAGAIHAYYTTPLGILIRRDLFGDSAHFISPLADELAAAVQKGDSSRTWPAGP
ncbi:MAG: hypothetical protein L6Q92_15130 [Phycisphaerae bacterium]|nr:hypothetical protein [Phycisphaerae bacterium]